LAYVLSVHSLSPPKPAGLDPPNLRRHAPNWMWNRDSPKKLKKKFHENFSEIFHEFFLNFFFEFFFWIFFLNLIIYFKTWLAKICKADSRVWYNILKKRICPMSALKYRISLSSKSCSSLCHKSATFDSFAQMHTLVRCLK
jgi:hypothetical protein